MPSDTPKATTLHTTVEWFVRGKEGSTATWACVDEADAREVREQVSSYTSFATLGPFRVIKRTITEEDVTNDPR